MRTLTVRNVPDDVYEALTTLAKRNRRSLQQQILLLLERARDLERPSPVVTAANWRKRLEGRPLGDTVGEIQEERRR